MSRKKKTDEEVLNDAAQGITVAEEDQLTPEERAAYKGPDDPRWKEAEKPVESKASKFKRLANRRVPRALKALQHVRNLTNRSQYAYTPQQSERIIEVLGVACQQVFAGFKGADSVAEEFFV